MIKFIEFMRRPKVWIYISVIYIWLYTTTKFIASMAPPYLIAKIADEDNSISMGEMNEALYVYIQKASEELGINFKYILYSHLANFVLLLPVLILGLFIIKRKAWAQNAFILLLILLILMPTLLSLFASEMSLNILNSDTLIYLAMIYLFTRKSTKDYFIEKST